jgi:DNA-binding transcriptional LysR family regulator
VAEVHQLRCYLATLAHGSFSGAAAELGYAQPSVSEQVRRLERHLGVELFHRLGRGVTPTEAGLAIRPHAEEVLRAVDAVRLAARSVREVAAGTVRFGIFGTSRLYFGAGLVEELLRQHPGVRVELIGQNSTEVADALRAGRLEAGLVGIPIDDEGLELEPLLRDELVYVSTDPARLGAPVDGAALAAAPLVLSEASWGDADSTRRQLARRVQEAGGTLRARVEVEDVETALEVACLGLADAVIARGVLHRLRAQLPAGLGWVPLEPPLYDTFAIAHRRGAVLSPATRVVVELVRAQLRRLDEDVARSR